MLNRLGLQVVRMIRNPTERMEDMLASILRMNTILRAKLADDDFKAKRAERDMLIRYRKSRGCLYMMHVLSTI